MICKELANLLAPSAVSVVSELTNHCCGCSFTSIATAPGVWSAEQIENRSRQASLKHGFPVHSEVSVLTWLEYQTKVSETQVKISAQS